MPDGKTSNEMSDATAAQRAATPAVPHDAARETDRAEDFMATAEAERVQAEQRRMVAEDMRAVREQRREELEQIRQQREELRSAAEETRRTAEDARHAAIAAVAATADSLHTSLARMQFLEDARNTLRHIQPTKADDDTQ